MTLILSVLTPKAVVQVTDRRLTTVNGNRVEVVDEEANKAIILTCADGTFSIAYTGLAEIKGQRTDEWIVDFLARYGAGRKPLPIDALREHATDAYLTLNDRQGKNIPLTIVISGFMWRRIPVGVALSNAIRSENYVLLPGTKAKFDLKGTRPPPKRMRRAMFAAFGETRALDPLRRRLVGRRRPFLHMHPRDVANELVAIIRAAHRTKGYGRFIGRHCMSTIVVPSGRALSRYHPLGKVPEIFAPSFVGPYVSAMRRSAWIGEGIPSWAKHLEGIEEILAKDEARKKRKGDP